MTTTSGEDDETNESSYTDMQIHDSELPEELKPENDLDPSGTAPGPGADADDPGAQEQLDG
jgi:hypothetical protein